MKVIFDTSAIIYLNDFREFDEILTVPEVIEEVKDRVSSIKLASLDFKILEPARDSVKEIKHTAKETGDLDKLSQTDMKVLALGKENKTTIISDDRNIQNVAERIGIKYLSVFNKRITKLITWRKFCQNCNKYYYRGNVCKVCGSKLVRVPVAEKEV